MPVTNLHREFENKYERWELVRDILENDAKKHIRIVDIADLNRSNEYKDYAILTNYTSLTQEGLTGLVFKKPIRAKLPKQLEYIKKDITGSGLTMNQFSEHVINELQATGRLGLLVDFPQTEGPLSKKDLEEKNIRPNICVYPAESITNWKVKTVGSKTILERIVLKEVEEIENESDRFEVEEKVVYRVLELNKDGFYQQEKLDSAEKQIEPPFLVNDKDGNPLKEIPFYFIGSENNDHKIDRIPLYDIAVCNLGHYRNSADYEESVYICGQPTLFTSSKDPDTFVEMNPNGIMYGARKGHHLGEDGNAILLQANANQLVAQAMSEKQEQMVSIGARLISPPGGRETAEGVQQRFASQNSALYVLTQNAALGIKRAIQTMCLFIRGANPEEVEFELNKNFYDPKADPNLIAMMWLGLDRQVISKSDVRTYLRSVNVIPDERTDEDIEKDIEEEIDPLDGVNPNIVDNNNEPEDRPNQTPNTDRQVE